MLRTPALLALALLLAVPTRQTGTIPRTTGVRLQARAPIRPTRATATASEVAPSTRRAITKTERTQSVKVDRALGGPPSRDSSSSIGVKRVLGLPAARSIGAAQENELIASAQFFVEQHARRRLLQQLWRRKPTRLEWAISAITFNYVDVSGNGRVEASELASVVSRHFDTLCPEVFEAFDDNGEGYLDFAAYAKITAMDKGAEGAAGAKVRAKPRLQHARPPAPTTHPAPPRLSARPSPRRAARRRSATWARSSASWATRSRPSASASPSSRRSSCTASRRSNTSSAPTRAWCTRLRASCARAAPPRSSTTCCRTETWG